MEKNMNEKINIRGVYFDNVTPEEASARVNAALAAQKESGKVFSVFTPNPEIVQLCIEQNEYYDVINSASMVVPDGIGVIKAAKILKTPLKARVPGIEIGERALAHCAEKGYRVFFLGGKPGVAQEAARRKSEQYAGLEFCGTADGYFKKEGEENDAVIERINEAAPDLLFVCLGVPAQEKWIKENGGRLTSVKVCLALGGSLDVYSGNVKRAPRLFIKLNLEWFYRLLCDPKRIGRMMKLPKFLIGTMLHGNKKNGDV